MKKLLQHKNTFLIVGILAVAGFFRLYKIGDYMTFLGDEGRDVLVVYNILHGKFTLLGPTSSVGGFFLGPLYYYLMAPFLWLFNYDPVGPAIMVALFGIVTVYLIYWVGKEFFDEKTGLIASLLYAISPLVVAYSRSSWNPNLMPITTLLTMCALYYAVKKNNNYLFIASGILLGILMQLHYLAVFVGAIIVVYVITSKWKKWAEIITDGMYLFAGFIIGWLPFLAFEARHGFQNIQNIIKFIFHSPDVGAGGDNYFNIVGNLTFRIFARLITKYPPPEQVSAAAHPNIAVWLAFTLLLIILTIIVFVKTYKPSHKIFAVWLIVGIMLFGFYKKPVYDYYFGFMFPVPFLLVGNMFSFFIKRGIVYRAIATISLAALVAINYSGAPFFFIANRQKDQVKQIADFVLSKTDPKPFNFALLTLGNSDHGYRYFFKLEGRDPVTILSPQVDPDRKSVTDQLLIVCEDQNCQPLGSGVWEVAGFGRAEIVGQWQVSVVKVYKLVHYHGKITYQ